MTGEKCSVKLLELAEADSAEALAAIQGAGHKLKFKYQ